MSSKKSKIKKIIILVVILILLTSLIITFFVVRNKSKKKNNSDNTEVVTSTTTIEDQISSDIINKKICSEYNGNYIFSSVANIQFNESLTISEQNQAYYLISGNRDVKDKNSFLQYLYQQKSFDTSRETLTFINGKYTKSVGLAKAESGLYFGNLDKSLIYLANSEGTIEINGMNYETSFEISMTGYWLPNNISNNQSTIFTREKIYYGNVGNQFMYVTYIYEMV